MKFFSSERLYNQKKSFDYSEEFSEKINNDKKNQQYKIFERLNFLNEKRKGNLNFLAKTNCENSFFLKDKIYESNKRKELLVEEHSSTLLKEHSLAIGNGKYHDNENNDNDNCIKNMYSDKNIVYNHNNDNDNNDNNDDDDKCNDNNHIDKSSYKIDEKISRNSFKNKTKISNWKDNLMIELNSLKNMTNMIKKTQNHKIKTKIEIVKEENANKIKTEKLSSFSENNFLFNIAFNYEKITLLSASLLNIKNDESKKKKNKKKEKENENENEKENEIATILLTNKTINNNGNNHVYECQSKINELASNNENSKSIADRILMHDDMTDLTNLTVCGNGLIEENKYDNNNNDNNNISNNFYGNNDNNVINHNNNNRNKDTNNDYQIKKKTKNIKLEMYEHLCQYGIAIVVKNEGSAVRDSINMDDSNIIGR